MMMQVNPKTMANKIDAKNFKMSYGHDTRLEIFTTYTFSIISFFFNLSTKQIELLHAYKLVYESFFFFFLGTNCIRVL